VPQAQGFVLAQGLCWPVLAHVTFNLYHNARTLIKEEFTNLSCMNQLNFFNHTLCFQSEVAYLPTTWECSERRLQFLILAVLYFV
jgi:hypothetical protein